MADFLARLASAPISWGVCEVPGWGAMLQADRVLAEMTSLGLRATELGAPGFLPRDPVQLKDKLARHDLALLGGFVPLVLHDPAARQQTLAAAEEAARLFAAAGATRFVTAAVVDEQWSPPGALTSAEIRQFADTARAVDLICADHGLTQVLHPHVQTLVETSADVERVLDSCDVSWCLDTGHLAIGGTDPVDFARRVADRVGHVHLKDVRLDLAGPVLARSRSLMNATQGGLFCPLGSGDVDIAGVVRTLEAAGYRGWYVIEQDTALTAGLPPAGAGPIAEVRSSLQFLTEVVAPTLAS